MVEVTMKVTMGMVGDFKILSDLEIYDHHI
jgi:hypothetical protein